MRFHRNPYSKNRVPTRRATRLYRYQSTPKFYRLDTPGSFRDGPPAKTLTGKPPSAKTLAEDLSLEEMDGVEGLLIEQRGLENLSNKMKGRDFSLDKNKSRFEAGKRVLDLTDQ